MPSRRIDVAIACFALMATAVCGYWDTSPLAILASAVMISVLRSEAHLAFAEKYAPIGRVRALAFFASASIAGNTVWCALAFGLGQFTATAT